MAVQRLSPYRRVERRWNFQWRATGLYDASNHYQYVSDDSTCDGGDEAGAVSDAVWWC